MSEIQTITLTAEQVDAMSNPDSDWLRMTQEQEQFIKSAAPDETCIFFEDVIIRLSKDRCEAIHEVAFKTALLAALEQIGATAESNVEVKCVPPELGQTFMRVTATDDTGKTATCVGMIPDPRVH